MDSPRSDAILSNSMLAFFPIDVIDKLRYALGSMVNVSYDGNGEKVIERTEVQFVFEGSDVEDATMDLADAADALSGFAAVYHRIATTETPDTDQRMRITAVRPGSINFVIELVAEHPEAAGVLVVTASIPVTTICVKAFYKLLQATLGMRGEKPRVSADENSNITLTNSDGNTINLTKNEYNLFIDKSVIRSLNQMVNPLGKEGIDAAVFAVQTTSGEELIQRVDAEDRPFFEAVAAGDSMELLVTDLIVTIASYSKITQKGFLYLVEHENKRTPFVYAGEDTTEFLAMYATYHDAVRVQCTARMRSDKSIRHITIHNFTPMQPVLFAIMPRRE